MSAFDERRYQVFVSSTFIDLQDERQRTLQAILEMHCFPAGMELFPSADDEQWEFIKREIDSSDYYVVILAGKYGSLAPDGTSFTEKEYDYALSISKPVMAFLFHDLNKLAGERLELDPARRSKLEAFHAKAKAGKLVKSYKTADELKSQVWQALTHAKELRPGEGWVRGRNGRRLEDLEELNTLRKRVIDLEKDLSELRKVAADPSSSLAQGDDQVEFELKLRQRQVTGESIKHIVISTTWNEILRLWFGSGQLVAYKLTVEQNLRDFSVNKAVEQHLIEEQSTGLFQIVSKDLDAVIQTMAIQFNGLGYVEERFGYDEWKLTQKGKLQVALIVGKRTKSDAS